MNKAKHSSQKINPGAKNLEQKKTSSLNRDSQDLEDVLERNHNSQGEDVPLDTEINQAFDSRIDNEKIYSDQIDVLDIKSQ